VQTLRELLGHELQAVAALEHGLVVALQDLADESAKKDVRTTFLRQQRQTVKHLKRLERLGARLGGAAEPARSPALEEMLRDKEAFVAADPTDELLDYYNLQLAARITHYAIGAYEGLVETAADRLQLPRVAHPLRAILEEKRGFLTTLRERARDFHVAFRQTGGVLEPAPRLSPEEGGALVGG
jgi:ferritin-like metal-binding protein YciE